MVSHPIEMTPRFRGFLERLVRDLRPDRVILFGSRARGTHRPDSDYDLLIVARRFRGVPWVERASLAIRLWDLPVDLEPICLTPEEFRKRSKEISIVGLAAREGILVFP
jgi:predicted nucleotidyltransferase